MYTGIYDLGATDESVDKQVYNNACVYVAVLYYEQTTLSHIIANNLADPLNRHHMPKRFFEILAPRLFFEGNQPPSKLQRAFGDVCLLRYNDVVTDEANRALIKENDALGQFMAEVTTRVARNIGVEHRDVTAKLNDFDEKLGSSFLRRTRDL